MSDSFDRAEAARERSESLAYEEWRERKRGDTDEEEAPDEEEEEEEPLNEQA